MRDHRSIVLTTLVDKRNTVFAMSALESMVDQINNGEFAVAANLQHDPTLPPWGQTVEAAIEPLPDCPGEYCVVAQQIAYRTSRTITGVDGAILYEQSHPRCVKPFRGPSSNQRDILVGYDGEGFASNEERLQFLAELQHAIPHDAHNKQRRSALPDPVLEITVPVAIATYLFGKAIAERAAQSLSETLGKVLAQDAEALYRFLRTAICGLANYAIPKYRPRTYIFVIAGDPVVEFAYRGYETDAVVTALIPDTIKPHYEQALGLAKQLNADHVQYLLEGGKWSLNYMTTRTGGVIGTPLSFSRRTQAFNLVMQKSRRGKRT